MKVATSILIFACTITLQAKSFDFKEYNRLVNKAELSITEDNYNQAILYYDSAFAIKEKPFAQDSYNASISAIKGGQLPKAVSYCHQLSTKGVGASFFNDKPIYSKLSRQKDWKRVLIMADKFRDNLYSKNKGLLHLLDSLAAKDQIVNHQWRESGMASREREIMDLTYDTLSQHLYRIFDSIGFVSEDMIGAALTKDDRLSFQLPYDIIVIHNYQARKQGDTLFRSMLYHAMKRGMIKPEYLASIEDFGSNLIDRADFGTTHFYIQYKCSIYLEKYSKGKLQEIYEARRSIGMGSTDDDLKKIIFKINHPGTDFIIRGNISKYMSFANTESEKEFLNNAEVIVAEIPGCKE